MEKQECSEPDCMLNGENSCQSTTKETYFCKFHDGKHIELSNKTYALWLVKLEPCKGKKEDKISGDFKSANWSRVRTRI